jgi:deoxycytidylate deaminase
MIRRKDSFGYIDFIRGKYVLNNLEQLQSIFNEMSISEREKIRKNDFETLWKMMWGETMIGAQYKGEEMASQKKFDALKTGVSMGNGEIIKLEHLIEYSTTKWKETEWEFPKGRRNYQERDLDCALREFEEETGISKKHIRIVENIIPFEEMFIGSNHLRNSYNNECICYSTHAEMDVLHKVLKKCTNYPFKDPFDLSNYSIVVVRFGKDGSLRNSRPCNHCLLTMVKYRIKKIMYSTDEGKMVTSKPQEMEHLHVSSGWNAFIHPERLKKIKINNI